MDWLDFFAWWLEKYDICAKHLKVITRDDWIDLLDAHDVAEDHWQAAFDNVLTGVDEELIEELYALCEFAVMERPSMSGDFSIYLDDGFPNEYKSALHTKWSLEGVPDMRDWGW